MRGEIICDLKRVPLLGGGVIMERVKKEPERRKVAAIQKFSANNSKVVSIWVN